jgi:hypothetical protein
MTSAPCPRCGGLAPVGATFCPFCGNSLAAPVSGSPSLTPSTPGHYVLSGPAPGSAAPPPPPGFYGWSPAPPGGYAPPGFGAPIPTPATRAFDRDALTSLIWASILWLAAGIVGIVLIGGTASLYTVRTTTTGTAYDFSGLFYVVIVASAVLELAVVVLLRSAFRRLAPIDSRFSTPSKLALLLIAGFLIVLLGLVPLVEGTQALTGCIANSTNTTLPANCAGLGDLLVGALVVLAGGIVALIGYIGCLLGIWRFGARYQNDLFKVGAILLIFPLVSIVGAILILVAARGARMRAAGLA